MTVKSRPSHSSSHPSSGSSPASPDDLVKVLAARDPQFHPDFPGRVNRLQAGVLVPLIWSESIEIVLTKRPSTMSAHAGELCFPGGGRDEADVDLEATALREAREEIGTSSVRVLGRLGSIALYGSNYRLEPVVGLVDEEEIRPDQREVERVLKLDVHETLGMTEWVGIPWKEDQTDWLIPAFDIEDAVVFGGTAMVLYEILNHLAEVLALPVPPLKHGKYEWDDVYRIMKG
jgi:8-oxo-dGTP pyrophosphatase MutT (NUDIX family)